MPGVAGACRVFSIEYSSVQDADVCHRAGACRVFSIEYSSQGGLIAGELAGACRVFSIEYSLCPLCPWF